MIVQQWAKPSLPGIFFSTYHDFLPQEKLLFFETLCEDRKRSDLPPLKRMPGSRPRYLSRMTWIQFCIFCKGRRKPDVVVPCGGISLSMRKEVNNRKIYKRKASVTQSKIRNRPLYPVMKTTSTLGTAWGRNLIKDSIKVLGTSQLRSPYRPAGRSMPSERTGECSGRQQTGSPHSASYPS